MTSDETDVELVRIAYSKVAEFQVRGVIHFHAIIRVDGPYGPGSPPLIPITIEDLEDAVVAATRSMVLSVQPVGWRRRELRWGEQVHVRPLCDRADREARSRPVHPEMAAAYNAKYLTKSTEDFGLSGHIESVADARNAGASVRT